MIPWLGPTPSFPPLRTALRRPNGLLAAGGDLSPERLLAAYRIGVFPWYSAGDPILWWSPDPRMVLFPDEFKVSRSLAKTLRNRDYEIRFDSSFARVLDACAGARPGDAGKGRAPGTWITPEMRAAYCELNRLGHAHSVETWIDGALAGGLYGVAMGRVFFGESMFSQVRDASKIAFAALVSHLRAAHYGLIDCQVHSAHLASLGARQITRREFSGLLDELVHYPGAPRPWTDVRADVHVQRRYERTPA